jgi:hypothetical protein
MLSVLGWAAFALGLLIGLIIIPFGLPGTFVIAGVALIAGIFTGFHPIGWKLLAFLFGLSVLVEVVEYLLSAVAAKKYGSSRWGMWGAILGGFAFAIWATPISPFIGTVFGAFIGAFLGAFFFEWLRFGDVGRAFRSGWGAFLGALGGRLLKFLAALVMVTLIAFTLL